MTVNAILNQSVISGCSTNPADLLARLNREVKDTLHRHNHDQWRDDGLDIGLCILNREAGKLEFAGARIDLYYNREGKITRLEGDKQSIGYQRSERNCRFINYLSKGRCFI